MLAPPQRTFQNILFAHFNVLTNFESCICRLSSPLCPIVARLECKQGQEIKSEFLRLASACHNFKRAECMLSKYFQGGKWGWWWQWWRIVPSGPNAAANFQDLLFFPKVIIIIVILNEGGIRKVNLSFFLLYIVHTSSLERNDRWKKRAAETNCCRIFFLAWLNFRISSG